MDFISEKRAGRRIAVITLLTCLLPQLLRIIFECFYAYEVAGNYIYPVIVSDLCLYGADILAQFSFFSVLGVLIYLSARNGLRGGVDTTVIVIGLYSVIYVLQGVAANTVFTLASYIFAALATAFAVIFTSKKNNGVYAIACAILAVPILGGVLQLYASNAVPSVDEIIFSVAYAAMNLVIELMFMMIACRVSKFLNERMKGEVLLTGKLISVKNPAMLSMLIFGATYILLTLIQPTYEIIDNIIEYGPPVNSAEWMSIIGLYVEYLIVFVIGYASMRFSAGLVEGAYMRAEGE